MSDEFEQKQCEAPSTGTTPVRPARPTMLAKHTSVVHETDELINTPRSNAKDGNKDELEGDQLACPRRDNGDVDGTKGGAGVCDDVQRSVRSAHLQDIDDFITAEGLGSTLDQFPEPTTYTFAISDNKGYFQDRRLLFLGETDSFQVWTRLKSSPLRPDEVEYVHFSFLSDTFMAAHNLARLPINMYPFDTIVKRGSVTCKEQLTVLVRYVFTEAAGINQPFSMEAKQTFRSVLVDTQEAIEKAGGADKLLNIHPPSKLPKSLSYISNPSILRAGKGANLIIDQSSDSETEFHQSPESPSERESFEVPAIPKPKRLVRLKVQPKHKPKPKTAVEKNTSVKRRVSRAKGQGEEQYEPKSRPKPKSKPKPKSTAAVKKVVPAKRRAGEVGDEDTDEYAELGELEEERVKLQKEKAEILERRANRKREEEEDADRMHDLEARGKLIDKEEDQLLKGKSAQWLLAYQRQREKE